jgi:oxygen-independent coproporphyrinogen-3 oxidase
MRESRLVANADLVFDSLYLGGGTPSLIPADQLAPLVFQLRNHFHWHDDVEQSIEANPGTVAPDDFSALRELGFNRLTIGIQSFQKSNLALLGRIHTANQAIQAYEGARQAGFDNIGIDLIYALPGQSENQWRQDLRRAVALGPEHISCYMLSFEPGTPFYRAWQSKQLMPLAEEQAAEHYRLAVAYLAAEGYRQYEISNFARRSQAHPTCDYRSRHNLKYWNRAPYIGLGAAAHSYRLPHRWWNHSDVDSYLKSVDNGQRPIADREILDLNQQLLEALDLGLRQCRGIDLDVIQKAYGADCSQWWSDVLNAWRRQGLLWMQGRCVGLTTEGMLLQDAIMAQLVELLPTLNKSV